MSAFRTLYDAAPVAVTGTLTERHANCSRLAVGARVAAVRIEDGARPWDRETLAHGPFGVPVTLHLPRDLAERCGFAFEEIAEDAP